MSAVESLIQNLEKVIIGKRSAIELTVVALICRGHLLIEDVPGLGKTILARSLAKSIALHSRRIQFTPDLLPSDITGVSILNQKTGEFEFRQGPVFTNILLADEINRATPRTQSSLLECMEEFRVSVDGTTHKLPDIFMVVATQNPIDMSGTFPLPEAQLDRFLMRISLGYPDITEEVRIFDAQIEQHPVETLEATVDIGTIRQFQYDCRHVHVDDTVKAYAACIVAATRQHTDLKLGASPRGTLALLRAAQAYSMIKGRDYVDPEPIRHLVQPVLAHRLLMTAEAMLEGKTADTVLDEILHQINPPVLG